MTPTTSLKVIAMSLEFLGTLTLAITVLLMHSHVSTNASREKIAKHFRIELSLAITSICFITIGFVILIIDAIEH